MSASSSERQSLVEDRHQSYNSTDHIDVASLTPQSDIYNIRGGQQTDTRSQTDKIRSPLASIFVYIMKQSYVSTLIIMMVWSITYHSWLTFVFLLTACIIWMIPHKRNVCLCVSPVVVCYAEGLLLIQYVYGFNLTTQELPTETASGYKYSQIGMMKLPDPCLHIGTQIAFTVCFMLTLRQYMRELHIKRQEYYMQGLQLEPVDSDQERGDTTETNLLPLSMGDVIDGQDSETIKALGSWVWLMLCKYWIIVCAVLLLVISIQDPVIYRIIYLGFFLYFVITFQICHRYWRFCVYVYWWIVIVYSMIVLLCIYTYQFDNFPQYWMNGTGMSKELLIDLGLETFSTAQLFAKLLTPTVFVIIICIQVHYFQKPFLKLSDVKRFRMRDLPVPNDGVEEDTVAPDNGENPDNTDGPSSPEQDETRSIASVQTHMSRKQRVWCWLKKYTLLIYQYIDRFSVMAWRILQIHIHKIVMFTIFICCMSEVCAINVILVLLVTILMPVTILQAVMSHLCQCYTGIVLLAKMVYQLNLVPHDYTLSNCTHVHNLNDSQLPYPFNETIDSATYVGLEKTDHLPHYLKNYVIIVVMLAFEAIIKIHQAQYYNKPETPRPPLGIVFSSVKRENADDGLVSCAKYFCNYAFYKFGLQICFIMTMVTMVVRLDAYSVVYGLFLAILLCLNRTHCYRVWPVYVIVLIVLLVLQYLSCLGVPAALCWGYPWDIVPAITRNLKIYLYLPNYIDSPDSYLLIADFFQLLFVCLQWNVFCVENSDEAEEYSGGSNKCILEIVEREGPNPVEDFLYCKASYLDYIKAGIFQYSFWATLIIVFIAGTAKISLFCLGYLVGFFFFLWFGMTLLTKPLRKVVRLWGILLGYTFFVILSKSCLQLVGCVYMAQIANGYCWVIQLLGLACLRARNYVNVLEDDIALESCRQSDDDAGLTYDAICFVFLLLQLRIYQSHYFRHVILDLEVQQSLASRGAELINMRLIRQVDEQKKREQYTLHQIKRKMEKIRLRQERLQHRALSETQDHYIVIRGGDRYMFEEDDEETESSIDALDMPDDSSDDDDKAGPLQILNAAMTGGTKGALQVVERQRTISEGEPAHSPSATTSKERKSGMRSVAEQDETDAAQDAAVTKDVATGDDSPDGPGTSTDLGLTECPCDDEEEHHTKTKDTCCVRFGNGLRVTWAFIGSILDSMVSVLMNISREYRIVSHKLDQEKETEKRRRRMAMGQVPVEDSNPVTDTPEAWPNEGEPSTGDALDSSKPLRARRGEVSIRIDTGDTESTKAVSKKRVIDFDFEDQERSEREFQRRMPRILQLLKALWEAVMSRSELLCYFAMVLNTLVSASLLSLPYPLSVFLWAMLSVPRPSKAYWITIMTYTEAVVVVKYLFQFGFFPWNDQKVEMSPFWPPRILGIEKQDGYAVFDLILLFCIFMHRSILNRHGLWKDATDIDADFALAEDMVVSTTNTPVNSPVKDDPPVISVKLSSPDVVDAGEENATYQPSTQTSPVGSQDVVDVIVMETDDHDDKENGCSSCCNPITRFYRQMTNPKYNAVTDVYAYMFFCDFIDFFIIVFCYWAFGPVDSTGAAGDEVVTRVIQNNKVPAPFLAMLLVQFVLIIVDRAMYLRKNIFGKFMFQICLVIVVHIWMFFILPAVTHRAFNDNVPAQLWYFIKCIYFGVSAYQIRSGYPTRILGNFLTKQYNYINLFLFKGFLLIPFLLELRALMDWMWTDTTLSISSWLKMEDIYASTYELKCWRWAERKYPTPRGTPRKKGTKYGVGGLLLFLLIFIIWFPLLLFSLASAVFKPNPPVDCTIEMKFGSFQPIFKMSAQQSALHTVSDASYKLLKDQYSNKASGTSFLSSYQTSDIYVAEINGISTATWDISPPSEASLRDDLQNDKIDIQLFTTIFFTREPKSGMTSDTVSTQFIRLLRAADPAMMRIRDELANMMNKTYHNENKFVEVTGVFPPFVRVPVNGPPTAALPLLGKDQTSWSNITYSKGGDNTSMWWILKDILPDDIYGGSGEKKAQNSLIIVSFNERVAPGPLSILTNYGILGLYLSFILVIGRFMRVNTSGLTRDVMFNFLPYVDLIWGLVKDIYLVREAGEYRLEEELFAKLMFLYRSPETLIDYTRFPPDKIKQD